MIGNLRYSDLVGICCVGGDVFKMRFSGRCVVLAGAAEPQPPPAPRSIARIIIQDEGPFYAVTKVEKKLLEMRC
jgi:hypothetical protein